MNDILDNPTLRVLRALDESPAMRAIRAFEDSAAARIMRDMDISPTHPIMRDLGNSPALKAIREIEESPITRMLRDLENSPTLNRIREIEESPAFAAIRQVQELSAIKVIKGLEGSALLDAFSTVASRITHGYGSLAFSEAYELLVDEYQEQIEEGTTEPLDNLAMSVKGRAAQAPTGQLSAEFFLSLIFALFLFYLSQLSVEESEELLLARLDDLEQTVSEQLDALRNDGREHLFLVADRAVNLRNGPGSEYDVLDVLPRNQKVAQIETWGDWAKVEYFDSFANVLKCGWVHNRYFTVVENYGN